MSSTDRQNRLLVAEDWKRIYQSYRNADFKSYDFDNLRRTMIAYLRENYPEDFNDYIESSEYLALIDLIAFLGQNIAFRIDLNARENYLELAERRESVLRLARLLSYNPKRNQCANGLLRIESVKTTEDIIDSNNINLANQTILWNDPSNSDWNEQFIKIMNSALPTNGTFGRPVKKDTVAGISTEQYRLNSTNSDVPAYSFNQTVDGISTRFEVVSTDIANNNIVEEAPFPGNNFAFLYRDDGKGAGSSNTGFFCHFRQGTLDQGTFTIDNPSSNQTVAIDATNINNSDIWLYKLDSFGNEDEQWIKVDSVEGNNIIYNSLNKNIRNIYSVLTRIDDRVSLIFSDGTFGNLPQGSFRIYYRTSKNKRIVVEPNDVRGVSINVKYLSKNNKVETITLTFALRSTVDNASVSETNASIRTNAPATYYTQNRLVTAEDYQIGPLAISQEIIKAKSVNRTASGISRYFDLLDATGKYSKTNLFGTDGVVYREIFNSKERFTFSTQTDVQGVILNTIEPILAGKKIRNYYLSQFPVIDLTDLNISWNQSTADTNISTGYFTNVNEIRQFLGTFTTSTLQLVRPGSALKFIAPSGKHFMPDGTLMDGVADHLNSRSYKWVKVISVNGNGTEVDENGIGPVVFNDVIPSTAQLVEIKPAIAQSLQTDVQNQIVDQVFSYKTFGLRFDRTLGQWRVINESNLNVSSEFSIGKTGDNSNQQLDSSWLLKFTTDGENYTIEYRGSRYVFESDQEIRFYFDSSDKIYNNLTGKIVKDKISVLNNNNKPDSVEKFTVDFDWEITQEYRDAEGYVNSKKVEVTFFDEDDDGVVDDPEIFDVIVDEDVNPLTKYVFQQKYLTTDGVEDYNYVSNSTLNIITLASKDSLGPLSQYDDGQVFYYADSGLFEKLNSATSILTQQNNYRAFIGRDNLRFLYIHAADDSSRIDPSASNIIDSYLLTRAYDSDFRKWLDGTLLNKPLTPSSDSLFQSYNTSLSQIKSLSDEIIYHPVKYKVLFGNKASLDLQAKFKIVKNPDLVLNDNDIKSRVISAVNQFFALENWDFGEKFYFSELSSYVMQQLAPDVVTFVIVPEQASQTFGSLYEIKSEVDEIFISGATVDDIEIIDAITASRLSADGNIVTTSTSTNTGITSSSSSSSSNSSSSSGGSSY
jgi:hypothetical protein